MYVLKGEGLDASTNYNFRKYSDVLELSRHAVDATRAEFIIEDGHLMLEESSLSQQRKHKRSPHSRATKQHPSIFIDYLRVFAEGERAEGATK